MIPRFYQNLEKLLYPQKVLVLYGPRRVGKTTLLQHLLKNTTLKYKLDSGDNIRTQEILGSQNFKEILGFAAGYDLIAIDEAQQIPKVGMGLKIIADHAPDIRVIVTGSSSFDLAHHIGEPLTGRKITLTLYPFAQLELFAVHNRFELKEKLNDFLIFGSYPEVVTASSRIEKIRVLEEIADSYLFKDILSLERIKNPTVLRNLLKLLAFQVGNQVSWNELAIQLGIDIKTVQRYLDLLEKTFVIAEISAFSRNLRKEIMSKHKYFFLDNGIRNAIINQFNSLDTRNDIGQLWENFVFAERLKKRGYQGIYANIYFWRTYDQQEIDFVEERDGKLFGYECKWSTKKKVKAPPDWQKTYKNASFEIINPENYLNFIT